ncbi:MAG: hypothetical protein MZV63_41130 [Marinilabiliales bacterium]|nr:hypothetical protein [Marinilabiliales bacterium]
MRRQLISAGRLGALGIEYRSGVAGTGIVGFIRGEAPGRRSYSRRSRA